MKHCYLLLLLSFSVLVAPAEAAMKTYTLDAQHQLASEMVPTLQAIVAPGGVVTSYHNVLIIKTTPENFQQLQLVIQQMDSPLQQVLISMTSNQAQAHKDVAIQLDDEIKTGDGNISTGNGNINQLRIDYDNIAEVRSGTQGVRATEGYPAFVQVGEQIPVNNNNGWSSSTGYKTVMRGFYVTVQINGGYANIEIQAQNDRLNGPVSTGNGSNSPQVELNNNYTEIVINGKKHRVKPIYERRTGTQGAATRVRVKLGEWVQIAGTPQVGERDSNQLNRYRNYDEEHSSELFLKVDPL